MKFVFLYHYYKEKIHYIDRIEFPPLGMLYICSMLQKYNHEVQVYYFDGIQDFNDIPYADIYAYSLSSTANYDEYIRLSSLLSNRSKLCIAGNTHATIFPEEVMRDLKVNAVFQGEAEVSIIKWLNRAMPLNTINPSIYTDNIDFPFPNRKLIPDNYVYMQGRVGGKSNHSISMITSRGCKYNCQFCAIQNRRHVRYRSTENIKNELDEILLHYPLCDGITIMDETFTQCETHAINIIKLLSKYNLPFECNSRVDTLTENIITALSNSTCKEIRIGIETGSQELIDKMKKGINLEDAKLILKKLSENKINIKIYLMHGYIGENYYTTNQTILFLNDVKNYIQRVSLYRFAPLPGSPIYSSQDIIRREWREYSIYNKDIHWWGTLNDYYQMCNSYQLLKREVDRFNSIHEVYFYE